MNLTWYWYTPSGHYYKQKSTFSIHSLNECIWSLLLTTYIIQWMNVKYEFLLIIITGGCMFYNFLVFRAVFYNRDDKLTQKMWHIKDTIHVFYSIILLLNTFLFLFFLFFSLGGCNHHLLLFNYLLQSSKCKTPPQQPPFAVN